MVTLHTQYQRLCDELKSQTRSFNVAWWRIGEILREIKDGKLYAEEKLTWEAFCERYLSFSKRHADSLIKDSKTHQLLEDVYRGMGRILPTLSADAVRAVEDLPPKAAAKVIEKVEKKGSVTADKIRASRKKPIDVPATFVPGQEELPHPANIPATVTADEAIEQAREIRESKRVCPHCGGAL